MYRHARPLSPPGGALRSTRLVRPARSIGRAPCLLPGARPSALLATRRELQKTLDAASHFGTGCLGKSGRFGRSGTKIGGLFSALSRFEKL
jgi:hypothetical protein